MKLIKTSVAVALLAVSGIASAQFGGAVGVVGGTGQAAGSFNGNFSGYAETKSLGNSLAASQIGGNGVSVQQANQQTGGTANIGASFSPNGAGVVSNQTSFSNAFGSGSITGEGAQAFVYQDGKQLIANGNQALAQTTGAAEGKANFANNAYGSGQIAGGFVGLVVAPLAPFQTLTVQ